MMIGWRTGVSILIAMVLANGCVAATTSTRTVPIGSEETTKVETTAPEVDETTPSPAVPPPSIEPKEDELPKEPVPAPQISHSAFPPSLKTCKGLQVSNSPKIDSELNIVHYVSMYEVRPGIQLALAPVSQGCFSSGYGPRTSSGKVRNHFGIDIAPFPRGSASDVLAAGSGKIVEAERHSALGNMVVINHGGDLYTRYAHLAEFAAGVSVGAEVKTGQVLGPMGDTADWPLAVHLHYEVLTGDYDDRKRSFGLERHNLYKLVETQQRLP